MKHNQSGAYNGAVGRKSAYQSYNQYFSDNGGEVSRNERRHFKHKGSNFSDLELEFEDIAEFDSNNNGIGNQIVVSFEELALNESTLCLKSLGKGQQRSHQAAPSRFFAGV